MTKDEYNEKISFIAVTLTARQFNYISKLSYEEYPITLESKIELLKSRFPYESHEKRINSNRDR